MNLNPRIMNVYQKAYLDEIKFQRDMTNYNSWLHNQYTLMAIGNALNGKKCKYPKKPFEISGENNTPETEEEYVNAMTAVIAQMNSTVKQDA